VVKVIRLPRVSLSGFALAFGFYHAVLGALSFDYYVDPLYGLLAIVLYLIALILSVVSSSGLRLGDSSAWTVFAIALVVPLLMSAALTSESSSGYATWHIAGIATVMAVLLVRQHLVLAWLGSAFMIVQTLVWGGLGVLFNSGVFGAFLLVLAAQLTSSLLANAARAAQEFTEQSIATTAQTEASTAARAERQRRIQETLRASLPLLEGIVESDGKMSPKDIDQLLLKEHELRDQIRGRALITPALAGEARAARERGVEVQLLDDGGLEDVDANRRLQLLDRVTKELAKVSAGKVVIRAVAGESWVLTMAAIRKDADRPDLFLRL
jgi:hypothetical protein